MVMDNADLGCQTNKTLPQELLPNNMVSLKTPRNRIDFPREPLNVRVALRGYEKYAFKMRFVSKFLFHFVYWSVK